MLRSIFLIVFIFLSTSNLNAEVLYWVGGTGDYNDSTHWSLSSGGVSCGKRPTLLDDVYFDENSFSQEGQVLTMSSLSKANTMDWSQVRFTPTWAGGAIEFYVGGNFILSSKMKTEFSGYITFFSKEHNTKITTAGNVLKASLMFNQEMGEWKLQDDLTSTKGIFLNNGTFNTNGKHLKILAFSANNYNLKSLVMTNSRIEIDYYSNYTNDYFTPYSFSITNGWIVNQTNFNLFSENSEIVFNQNATPSLGSNLDYHLLTFLQDATLNNNGWYLNNNLRIKKLVVNKVATIAGNLKIGTALLKGAGYFVESNSIDSLLLTAGMEYRFDHQINYYKSKGTTTINNYLKAVGTCVSPISFISGLPKEQASIQLPSSAFPALEYVTFTDINMNGGAVFYAKNSVDVSNNTGITFIAPASKTVYWVGGTGSWYDKAHWSASSGGSGGYCLPTKYDHVVLDKNSFTDSLQVVTIEADKAAYCLSFTADKVDRKVAIFLKNHLNCYGSVVLSANLGLKMEGWVIDNNYYDEGSTTTTPKIIFEATTTGNTITSNGCQIGVDLAFNGHGGEWTLMDNLYLKTRNVYNNADVYSRIYHKNGSVIMFNRELFIASYFSKNTTTRKLNVQKATVNLYDISYPWYISGTGYTLENGGLSVINFHGVNATMTGGDQEYGKVNFTNTTYNSYYNTYASGSISNNGKFKTIHFAALGSVSGQNTIDTLLISKNGTIWGGNNIVNYTRVEGDLSISGGVYQTIELKGNLTEMNYEPKIGKLTVNGNAIINGNAKIGTALLKGAGYFVGSNSIDSLLLTAGMEYRFDYNTNYSIKGTTTINNFLKAVGTCVSPISFISGLPTEQASILLSSSAVAALEYVTFTDIERKGDGEFNAQNSVDVSNNSGVTFITPASKTVYWVGGTGSWYDKAHWSASSGGAGGYCLPTKYDHVVLDQNSFSDSLQIVTIDADKAAYCLSFTADKVDRKVAMLLKNHLNCYGSVALSANLGLKMEGWVNNNNYYDDASPKIIFEATTTGNTITSNGCQVGVDFAFNGQGGEWTLMDNLYLKTRNEYNTADIYSRIYHKNGNVILSNRELFIGAYISKNTTTRKLNLQNATVNLYDISYPWYISGTGYTLENGGSSALTCHSWNYYTMNFTGGDQDYGKINFTNKQTIYTFPTINNNGKIKSIYFAGHGSISGQNTIDTLLISKNGTIWGGNNIVNYTRVEGDLSISGGVYQTIELKGNLTEMNYEPKIGKLTVNGNAIINGNAKIGTALLKGAGYFVESNSIDSLLLTPGMEYRFDYNTNYYKIKGTTTINNYLKAVGTCVSPISFISGLPKEQASIQLSSSAVAALEYVTFTDIEMKGDKVFNAPNSIDVSNNTGITFIAPASKTVYWVGGTGYWYDKAHWSASSGGSGGYCLPTKYDHVVLDQNSFSDSLQVVTIEADKAAYCLSFTADKVDRKVTMLLKNHLNCFGSVALSANLGLKMEGWVVDNNYYDEGSTTTTPKMIFEATTTGNTITSNGCQIGVDFAFNGQGEWTLMDNLYLKPSNLLTLPSEYSRIYHKNGKVIMSNRELFIGAYFSKNTTTRKLNVQNATVNLYGESYYYYHQWYISGTGYSLENGNTSVFNFHGLGDPYSPLSFVGGDQEYGNVNFTNTNLNSYYNTYSMARISNKGKFKTIHFAANGSVSGNNHIENLTYSMSGDIGGDNVVNTLNFLGQGKVNGVLEVDSLKFTPSKTYDLTNSTVTINKHWENQGDCSYFTNTYGSDYESAKIKATNTLSIAYNNLKNVQVISGTIHALNCNNFTKAVGFKLAAPAARTLYWVKGMGKWSDVNHWSLKSGGVGGACLPSSNDNVIFDANSFPIDGATVSIDAPALCKNMDWTGCRRNPLLSGTAELWIYGGLTLSPDMQFNFTNDIRFKAKSKGNTIKTMGINLANNIYFDDDNYGGSWILQDDITTNANITLVGGSLNTNDKTLTCNTFSAESYLAYQKELILGKSLLNLNLPSNNSWNLSVSNIRLDAGTSSIVFHGADNISFSSGDLTYNDVSFKNINSNVSVYGKNNYRKLSFYGRGTLNDINNKINYLHFYNHGAINGRNVIDTLHLSEEYNYTLGYDTLFVKHLIARGKQDGYIGISSNNWQSTIHIDSATVCTNYLNMSGIHASGKGTFNAGKESKDIGNNKGWNFTSCYDVVFNEKNPSCFAANDGQISIKIEGGKAPFTIKWNGKQVNDTIFSNLVAGNYLVEVSDSSNTFVKKTIELKEPTKLAVSITKKDASCLENNGWMNALPTGGVQPYSYVWSNGVNAKTVFGLAPGSYSLMVKDFNNCTVSVTQEIVNTGEAKTNKLTKTICQGSFVEVGNNKYIVSGEYEDILTTKNGCDSIVKLTLIVKPKSIVNQSIKICEGTDYKIANKSYNKSGTYIDTLISANGCDSIVSTELIVQPIVKPVFASSFNQVVCYGSASQIFPSESNNGILGVWSPKYDSLKTTEYTFTPLIGSCASIEKIQIKVLPLSSSLESILTCGSYDWNGKNYTQSGEYTFATKTKAGCDSIATLKLTINQPSTSTTTQIACGSYDWNGKNYTQSGEYTFATKTKAGCDSVATLKLTINQLSTSTTTQTACGSYDWNGKNYSQSGEYTFATKTKAGCDSIATLKLTINQPSTSTTTQTACGSYDWNGKNYSQSGEYTFATKTKAGCDSVATLKLTIKVLPDVAVSMENKSILVKQENALYTWINCDNSTTKLANNTEKIYTPKTDGTYAVIVDLDGCKDTSSCVKFGVNSIELRSISKINIYPNPSSGNFTISNAPIGTYTIVDELGKVIHQFDVKEAEDQKVQALQLSKGIYFLRGSNANFAQEKIVVIE